MVDYSKLFNEKALQHHLQLSLAGEAADAGLQELNNAPFSGIVQPKDKKKKNDIYTDLLRLITSTQIKLLDFIDRMDRDLIIAKAELQRYLNMMKGRKSLTNCIEVLEQGEVLERNADGSLKDKHLLSAIEHYAKDHNLKTDFSDDAYVLTLARHAIKIYPTSSQLEQLAQVQSQILDVLQTGHDEAVIIQQELDSAGNITDDDVQEKCEKAHNIMQRESIEREFLVNQKNALLSNNNEHELTLAQHFELKPSF